jgi:uncharacterized membrane protein
VKNRIAERIALVLIIAMFALAAWTWPSAPAQIPIHWDIAGQVNGYGPKAIGLLLMPSVALAGYALIGLSAAIRPEQFDLRAMKALSWFRCAYVTLMAGVFGAMVADIRGANLNMNYVVFPLLALMMIASANLIVQLSRLKGSKAAPPGGGIRI